MRLLVAFVFIVATIFVFHGIIFPYLGYDPSLTASFMLGIPIGLIAKVITERID